MTASECGCTEYTYCDIPSHEPKWVSTVKKWVTKDSGKREDYVSGMRRDTQQGKPRFDLLVTDGLPYEAQFLHRFASLLARGADKYGERNWQLANSPEELSRFRASGFRHFMQYMCGEEDEDHAAAVAFNLMAAEYVKWKIRNATTEDRSEELEDSSSGDSSEHPVPGDGQQSDQTASRFLHGRRYNLLPNSTLQPDESYDNACCRKGLSSPGVDG